MLRPLVDFADQERSRGENQVTEPGDYHLVVSFRVRLDHSHARQPLGMAGAQVERLRHQNS